MFWTNHASFLRVCTPMRLLLKANTSYLPNLCHKKAEVDAHRLEKPITPSFFSAKTLSGVWFKHHWVATAAAKNAKVGFETMDLAYGPKANLLLWPPWLLKLWGERRWKLPVHHGMSSSVGSHQKPRMSCHAFCLWCIKLWPNFCILTGCPQLQCFQQRYTNT